MGMNSCFAMCTLPLLCAVVVHGQERAVESILPELVYGAKCASSIEVRNLGEQAAVIEVEGHRASGALVPLAGRSGNTVRLAAGERGSYKLEIAEETMGA